MDLLKLVFVNYELLDPLQCDNASKLVSYERETVLLRNGVKNIIKHLTVRDKYLGEENSIGI